MELYDDFYDDYSAFDVAKVRGGRPALARSVLPNSIKRKWEDNQVWDQFPLQQIPVFLISVVEGISQMGRR